MHDVDHVGRGVDATDLGGRVALERGGGDSAGAAGVVEDEGASGQCGEDGGDDMGGDGAGGAADAAFVGGGGAAEGRQEVGERGVGHRRDRRYGFLRGGHCGWYGSEDLILRIFWTDERNREHDAVRNRYREIDSRR